jgi:cyclopropane-fatty-acyl-phospholipid synthase
LDHFLKHLIVVGDLTVIGPDNRPRRYGSGAIPGVGPVVVRVPRRATALKLALHPALMFGEAYMNGAFIVEEGDIFAFVCIALFNIGRSGHSGILGWPDRFARLARRALMRNPIGRSRRNVAHHYDLSEDFYRLFLDEDRQYSCAYFEHPGASLEEAQAAKKRHIAAKLRLSPGQRVLDIGCGWGGLAISLARAADVRVTGITLSDEQLKVARARVEAAGVQDKVGIELCDYRQVTGRFDRIVSVGMFEHVGIGNYRKFFHGIRAMLTDNGIALLHSIGRSDGPGLTNAWVRKYIFPGGYVPALSEVLPAVEKAGLIVTDIEVLRLHYAKTVRAWRQRFMANWDTAERLYDARFCRMWEFYLATAEASFLYDDLMVFQMQLAKSVDSVPITRGYITDWENEVRPTLHWHPNAERLGRR